MYILRDFAVSGDDTGQVRLGDAAGGIALQSSTLSKGYNLVMKTFPPPGRPEVQWPGFAPLPGIAGKMGLQGYDGSSCAGR
jgi:hypothetical protein